MKKILIICDAFNERGGVEKIVNLLANHYSVSNNVQISVRFKLSDMHPYSLSPSVSINSCGIDVEKSRSKFVKFVSIFQYIERIRVEIQKFQPDVIFCNGVGVASLTVIAASGKYKKKIVICDHNKFDNATWFWAILRRFTYRHAKHIISLTQEDLKKYQSLGQASCVYNPVIPPENVVISELGRKVVMAVGRLDPQKGFDLLIKSWALVNEKHPDWVLKIVGDGREKEKLLALITKLGLEQKVHLEPSTNNVFLKFAEASLFVLSSRYEGFGLVVIEAMSAGLPVIAFDCRTGPKEILSTGGGFLVTPENCIELAEVINRYMDSPQTWKNLSSEAIETSKRFSLIDYKNKMNKILLDE